MTAVNTISSNVTGLAIAEEASIGVLPGTPVWVPMEPNSYGDFGGKLKSVSRNPISTNRQRKKGVVVDKDATAGFNSDLTQTNLQDVLQGFIFANFRRKAEVASLSGVTSVNGRYTKAAGLDVFRLNDIVFASGFTQSDNNGMKVVDEVAATYVGINGSLINETPAATAKLVAVGHQFASGDLTVDASGSLPQLKTTTKDLTQLGIVAGEMIYIGGDAAGVKFANAANNGWARVRSVAANAITLDKASGVMVTDTGAGKTVQVFLGRVLKNEVGSSIVRRTYQLERQLGAPDDALPAQIQSEYVIGAVPNEFKLNVPTADKVTADLSFVGLNTETRTGAEGVKSGTRATLAVSEAFNTSSDTPRIRLVPVSQTDEYNTALFAFGTDLTLNIKNNVTLNKAIGVLGGFEANAGTFEVSGSITAYFSSVEAIRAVEQNTDVSIDFVLAAQNAGIAVDIPLISLGNGQVTIEQDQPVKIPLDLNAAIADKVYSGYNHTLMMVFFDYLPTAAT